MDTRLLLEVGQGGTVAKPKVLVYYDLGMRCGSSLNLFQTAHFALKVTYPFQNLFPNDYNNPFRVPLHIYNSIAKSTR